MSSVYRWSGKKLNVFGVPSSSSLNLNSVTPCSLMIVMCTAIKNTINTGRMAACRTKNRESVAWL